MNTNPKTYQFLPTSQPKIIKVIGVGGGGCNAVNHMFTQGIHDVEFIICNTDIQALASSPVPNKVQIGVELTSGLGAGSNPERGRASAIESKDNLREILREDTKMLFITAGMGGGTGTGAAPIIASIAKELDILTVGIVTHPFSFEGKKKRLAAEEGIRLLREHCDTVIVILNDKLKQIYGNLSVSSAFAQADNILTTAAKSIAEIITLPGYINVDFEDVKTVMGGSGAAVMGSARASGIGRAIKAAERAISSPLLDNRNLKGAKKILLSIRSGENSEMQMDELTEITDHIHKEAGIDSEVIFGHGIDNSLGDFIMVTIIATGFTPEDTSPNKLSQIESDKIEINKPEISVFNGQIEENINLNEVENLPLNRAVGSDTEGTNESSILQRHRKLMLESQEREDKAHVYHSFCKVDQSSKLNWKIYDEPTFLRRHVELTSTLPHVKTRKIFDLKKLG